MTDPPREVEAGPAGPRCWVLIGQRLFVDFVNTRYRPAGGPEPLSAWPDLAAFAAAVGMESADDAAHLAAGLDGPGLFNEALALRGTLLELIETVLSGRPLPAAIVEALNRTLPAGDGGMRLAGATGTWRLVWHQSEPGPRRILGPLARSAADFLTRDDPARLRRCAQPDCPLFFYDVSRAGTRRWCRMDLCGNRHKALAHQRRRGRAARLDLAAADD